MLSYRILQYVLYFDPVKIGNAITDMKISTSSSV